MDSSEPKKEVRLQKLIADAGICSRRAAEALVAEGAVKVNGKTAEIGQKADPGKDRVLVSGKPLPPPPARSLTLAMNKPRGYLCSNSDPHHHKTVFQLLPPEFDKIRLFCAGRLDKESEGLLILTTDGDLTHRLLHPSRQISKRYRVRLQHPFLRKDLPRLLKGVRDEGELLRADKVYLLGPEKTPETSDQLEVHLHHGRKREIRRLFECVGCRVRRLKRIQIGGYVLKGLAPGKARVLGPADVKALLEDPVQGRR